MPELAAPQNLARGKKKRKLGEPNNGSQEVLAFEDATRAEKNQEHVRENKDGELDQNVRPSGNQLSSAGSPEGRAHLEHQQPATNPAQTPG